MRKMVFKLMSVPSSNCNELTGDNWLEQINHLINTTDELPLDQLLPEFGLSFNVKNDKSLPFGLKLADKPEGVVIQQARREGSGRKQVFCARCCYRD